MTRRIVFIFVLLLSVCWGTSPAHALTLKEKCQMGKEGDFIVTTQEGNYSLLLLRTLSQTHIQLEEISIPTSLVPQKKQNWKEWVAKKAPGHTAWIVYTFDVKTGTLTNAFSYTKNEWLHPDAKDLLIAQLIQLPLTPLSDLNRKKIGLISSSEGTDTRALWNPPKIFDGKKQNKPEYTVYQTYWPEDHSSLASAEIQLYFSTQDPSFPFPYWMEIQSTHYAAKIRVIDSGHALRSPMPAKVHSRP